MTKNKNSLVYYHSSFFANPFKYLKDKKLLKKNYKSNSLLFNKIL